jgi:WD40 repeat protein/tRNA A-37 threonylcarbamoyl transferase component Bud32
VLLCANGHQWTLSDAQADAAVLCPRCGAPALPDSASPSTVFLGPTPHRERPPENAPVIAGYDILQELGRGGMGVVYKARDTARDRVVAVKVILTERSAHPEIVHRFRREAQAAARLSHPNIVTVYDCDRDGDLHFLAMEYVPGITLQRLVDQSGPLPVAQASEFVRQTALGLQHASEQGLVHRDIKPSNLMVVEPTRQFPGARPIVKILDMGVARLYQLRDFHEESLTTLTRDGVVIGTPDFIAPEQLENPHEIDVRADIYSLGCTFYFLLSGQVPFPSGTLIQKLDRQRWQTPPSVDQLRPEVPAAVAAVVRRMMNKHPDDRYRTPAELAAALDQLRRTGELPSGHQPAPLRETRDFTGHDGAVRGVGFLPGVEAVSAGADRTLRLWDVATGRERLVFGSTPQEIGCLAVSPVEAVVFAGHGAGIRQWDAASGREMQRFLGHTDAVRSLAVSPDGTQVLSGGDDRSLRLWDVQSGGEITRFLGHRARVTSVALSGDGRWAASGSQDQTLRLWDLATGREVRSFAVPRGQVLAVAFAPDGRAVLSSHFDTTVRLWEVETGRELRRFSGHRQMVSTVLMTASGLIVSGSHDRTVRLWDADSGSELICCQGHTGPVTGLAVAPDGKSLLSCGADQTIRLWQLPEA